MAPVLSELPSSLRSVGRSLQLGYRAEPLLIVVAFVTALAAAAPDALFALVLAALAEAVVSGRGGAILAAALALGALATGGWLLRVFSERVNLRLTDRAGVEIESHVVRLQASVSSIEHHERPDHLDRLSLLRDHASALSELHQSLFSVMGAVLRLGITVVLLMSVHPALGLLGLFAVPPMVASHWRAGIEKRVEEAGAQHARRARHVFLVGTTPGPGKEVRTAAVQQRLRRELRSAWMRRHAPLARARWATAAWQSAAYAVFGGAFVVGVVFVAEGGGTVGDVLLVLAAGSRLSQYLGQTVRETHFFRTIWLDGARRLVWLEDLARAGTATADQPVPDRLRHGIRFENVSFRYPGTDRTVLNDVTVDLPAGAVVAIVGENGAGKTSLVKLLAKLYDPSEGRVTVDGTDLTRIPAAAWRARMSGAFQDFFTFEFPVRTSVGVGDVARVDDRPAVEAAVERAGAGDVVARLGQGLDTQLGATWARGVDLSHGQWQKVALARGFMRERPLLLVLDEPTSALDAETEHALFTRYATAARGGGTAAGAPGGRSERITILVSHRFSTVRMADLIVVLDGGRLVEQGSHEKLMARGGLYAELYDIQARSYRQ